MAKKYPVLYTILVWIGIAVFGSMMFFGMYILSFVPEIPASDGEVRQMLIENGAAIVALGATTSSISACHCGATARHSHR
jgi:hypothetical protein